MDLKKIYKDNQPQSMKKSGCFVLVVMIFLVIFLSRVLYLGADQGSFIEIESSHGGYNARNKVWLGHWPLYMNWYQPMGYMPVQNFVSYLSFRFFGVGTVQFRFPCVLATFAGLIFFYLILLKQTNRSLALLGLLLYAFNYSVTTWNRSSLTENFYLFFMPVAIWFLVKDRLRGKDIFFFTLFSALNVVAKVDSYPFYLAAVLFLIIRSLKVKSFFKTILQIFLGSLCSLAILLFLFAFTDCFRYIVPLYSFYRTLLISELSLAQRIIPTLKVLIETLIRVDPYILLAFLTSIPILVMERKMFKRIDWFMVIFFLITLATRLIIPPAYFSFKRVIFLIFPVVYLIFRSLFFLWENEKIKWEALGLTKLIMVLSMGSMMIPLVFFLSFVPQFTGAIFSLKSYYFIIFILFAILIANFVFLFGNSRFLANTLLGLICFFVFISLLTNGLKVIVIFFPENIKYTNQENIKFAKMIPESEIIIGHEQGFRAFSYLSKHTFLFNHDGGPNPEVIREVIERRDIRYFILNISDFEGGLWGIPTSIKMQLIKDVYPNVKLMGVMRAMKIPLAIYDKYGTK